ncbi:hypothetical protein OPQ81_008319 [Rhizoctonia solani]|nr:hypothetical protein OPQ81_008319 [Rhizoctonia solani]
MSLQHLGKGALRVAKNYTKGYSDVQAKVRDATSNDPWGPSGTQMNDIAQMTYNQNDFVEIMEMLDKRLNDKGKNWRHVFKALTVLDYCLHAGSENTVIYFKDNLYVIKTLKEFQYVDEYGKDQGANVRQKAKDITNLLMDENRLREERRSRASMRDRMVRGGTGDFGADDDAENENRRRAQQMLGASRSKNTKEDDEMRRAIEASKRSLADEQRRQGEEQDLAKAIALSEQEEAARKRALQNSGALFDDQAGPGPSTNGTSGGDLLIDFNAAPPQQPLQPQFTSFNPYLQQAQQQAMQQEYLRQQAEWEAMQAQAQAQAQQEAWMQQQQQQQQQQLLQAQQQEEWNRQQLMLQQQAQQQQFLMQQQMQSPLMAQPTGYGSNNPFAMMGGMGGAPQSPPVSAPAPSMSPFPSASSPSIAQQSSPSPQPSLTQSNTMANSRRTPANDGANSHLANLIANREDGMDTFGNIGQLRFGHGQTAQRLVTQQTGHNPFNRPQQQQNEQPFFTV